MRHFYCLAAIARLADNLDILLSRQEGPKSLPHDHMIFNEQHGYFLHRDWFFGSE